MALNVVLLIAACVAVQASVWLGSPPVSYTGQEACCKTAEMVRLPAVPFAFEVGFVYVHRLSTHVACSLFWISSTSRASPDEEKKTRCSLKSQSLGPIRRCRLAGNNDDNNDNNDDIHHVQIAVLHISDMYVDCSSPRNLLWIMNEGTNEEKRRNVEAERHRTRKLPCRSRKSYWLEKKRCSYAQTKVINGAS